MAPAEKAADGLTDWERARAENLKANKAALGGAGTVAAKIFRNTRPDVQKKPPAPRRKVKAETPSKASPLPTRRSARVAGIEADDTAQGKREGTAEAEEDARRAKRARIDGTVDLSSTAVDGKMWRRSGEGLAGLQLLSRGAQPHHRTFTDEDVEETTDAALKKMREAMSGLELYDKFEVKGGDFPGAPRATRRTDPRWQTSS